MRPGPRERPRGWSRGQRRLLAAALCTALAACLPAAPAAAPEPFRTGTALVVTARDTFALRVEIAESEAQQSHGLMGRTEIPEDYGMLFVFDEEQPADAGLWMYRTPVPLSAAYLDRDGVIVALVELEPCTSALSATCRLYPAGVPFFAALEVSRGYFARRGVAVGDRVIVRPEGGAGR